MQYLTLLQEIITISTHAWKLYSEISETNTASTPSTTLDSYQARDIKTINALQAIFSRHFPGAALPLEFRYYEPDEQVSTTNARRLQAPTDGRRVPYCHLPTKFKSDRFTWGNGAFKATCQLQVRALQKNLNTLNKHYAKDLETKSLLDKVVATATATFSEESPPAYGHPNDAIRMLFASLITSWVALSHLDLNNTIALTQAQAYRTYLKAITQDKAIIKQCHSLSHKATQVSLITTLRASLTALEENIIPTITTQLRDQSNLANQGAHLITQVEAVIAEQFRYACYIVSDEKVAKEHTFLVAGKANRPNPRSCLSRLCDELNVALQQTIPTAKPSGLPCLSEDIHQTFQIRLLTTMDQHEDIKKAWPVFNVLNTQDKAGFFQPLNYPIEETFREFCFTLYGLGLSQQSLYHLQQLLAHEGDAVMANNPNHLVSFLNTMDSQLTHIKALRQELTTWGETVSQTLDKKQSYDLSKQERRWQANYHTMTADATAMTESITRLQLSLIRMVNLIKTHAVAETDDRSAEVWRQFTDSLTAVNTVTGTAQALPTHSLTNTTTPLDPRSHQRVPPIPLLVTTQAIAAVAPSPSSSERLIKALSTWFFTDTIYTSSVFQAFWTCLSNASTLTVFASLPTHQQQCSYEYLEGVSLWLNEPTSSLAQRKWAADNVRQLAWLFIYDKSQGLDFSSPFEATEKHYFDAMVADIDKRFKTIVPAGDEIIGSTTPFTVDYQLKAMLDFLLKHRKPLPPSSLVAIQSMPRKAALREELDVLLREVLQSTPARHAAMPGGRLDSALTSTYVNLLDKRLYPIPGQRPELETCWRWNALLTEGLTQWAHHCQHHTRDREKWQTITLGLIRLGASPLPWLQRHRQTLTMVLSNPNMKPLFFVLIQHTAVIAAFIDYQAPHLGSTHALLFNALTNLTQTLAAFSHTLINQVKANERWYWRLFFTVFFQDNGAARDERAALWQAALTWYFTLLHDALLDPDIVSQTPDLKKATQEALTAAQAQFEAACAIYHQKVPTESWCRDKDRAGYEALKQAFTVVGDCQDKIATLRWEQHLVTEALKATQTANEATQTVNKAIQEKEAVIVCNEEMGQGFRQLYQEALFGMLTTQWQAVTGDLPNPITPVDQEACWQTVIVHCKQGPAYQALYNRFKKYNTASVVLTDDDWSAFKAVVLSAKPRSEKDEAVPSSSPRPTSGVARQGLFAAANTPIFSSASSTATSSMSSSSTSSTSTPGNPSPC